jgi:hypothetical protein
MKLILTFLLFAASALAQQSGYPEATPRSNADDLRGYSNVPTCDPKYDYVGVEYDQNLIAQNKCMPQTTVVSLRDWEEMKAQLAELRARVRELEAANQTHTDAASSGNGKPRSQERK